MTTYNVALNEGVDYDAFWQEIETDGSGSVYVPQRGVAIVNERPTSLRQCWYELTDDEADKLRQDPRVRLSNEQILKSTTMPHKLACITKVPAPILPTILESIGGCLD